MTVKEVNEKQIQALNLIRSTRGMNLTHLGNTIVSRQAKSLLDAGLICYGSGRVAYVLTAKGLETLASESGK